MNGFTSLDQMLLAIRARWRAVAVVTTVVLVVVLAVTAFIKPTYQATTDIIFNSRTNDAIVDRGDGTTFNAYISAEMELMASERVLMRLAADPRFLADPAVRAQIVEHEWSPIFVTDRLAALLARSLTVAAAKNSRTVSISVSGDDPAFAAAAANGVAAAYLATSVDLRVAQARSNVAFFRTQKAARAQELARTRARLDDFLRKTGMTGREAGSDVEETQLRAMTQQRSASQAQLAQTNAEASVGQVDAGIATGAINSAVVQALRSEVVRQTVALAELSVNAGPNNPSIVSARERLTELTAQLDSETARVASGLRRRNISATLEANRIGALETSMRATMSATATARSQLALLSGEVERAKANYDAVTARLAEVELASSLDQPNAAILSKASPPVRPTSPSWPFSALVGGLAGLVVGLGLALFAELRQPRVRSWRDAEAALGAPVLCDMAG